MSTRFKFGAQFLEVVDLTVEDQRIIAIRRDHGLVSQRGKIDDRQTSMPKPDKTIGVETLPIRSAVFDRIGHFFQDDRRNRFAIKIENSGDSAHLDSQLAPFNDLAQAVQ